MNKVESKKKEHKTPAKPPIYKGDPDVFDVERILKKRRKGNQTEYFIKWLGYPESENLWINESDITPDLIEEFHLKERNCLEESLVVPTSETSESVCAPDEDQNDGSYFEENLQNLGCNLLLESVIEDLRLFSICTLNGSNASSPDQSIEASTMNNGHSYIEKNH